MMSQVTRWDPFENLLKDFRGLVLQPVDLSANNPDVPVLKIDVKEDSDAYTVHADLPGVPKDDILHRELLAKAAGDLSAALLATTSKAKR